MTLQIERIDVGAVIADVLDVEQQLAEQKHIALEARLSTEPLVAQADREVLQRVLINLVDNALKFAPQQGQVWIEGRALAEDAGVQIAVVDTGPGVPVEERERIFEKFTRVRGQAPVRRGVGLGLTFCQMAVEAHGGQIWIEDGPGGRGSRFVFTILAGVGGNDACEV